MVRPELLTERSWLWTVAAHKRESQHTIRSMTVKLIAAVVVVSTETAAVGMIEADADPANVRVPMNVEDRTSLCDGYCTIVVAHAIHGCVSSSQIGIDLAA